MERRWIIFIVLASVIWIINLMWMRQGEMRRLAEQQAARQNAEQQNPGEPAGPAGGVGGDAEAPVPGDGDPAAPDGPAPAVLQPGDPAAPAQGGGFAALRQRIAAEPGPAEFVSAGSVDLASGYRILVTFDSRGGAIRRVEFSNPRFLEQHDRSGYLGHLELRPAAEASIALQPPDADPGNAAAGAVVGVVGAGTPAAEAGLRPGDVILAVTGNGDDVNGAVPVGSDADLRQALARSRPGDQITLSIRRDGAQQQLPVTLAFRPLELIRPERDNLRLRGAAVPADYPEIGSFLTTIANLEGKKLTDQEAGDLARLLEQGNWDLVPLADGGDAQGASSVVTFEMPLPEFELRLVKRYTLVRVPPDRIEDKNYRGYHVQLDVEVHNLAQERPQTIAYQLQGPNGLPIEGWWYTHKLSRRWFSGGGLRDVVVRSFERSAVQLDCAQIANGDVETIGQGQPLAYIGVDCQYFASVLIPQKPLDELWFDTTDAITVGLPLPSRTPTFLANTSFRMTRLPVTIEPGGMLADSFEVFLGPKRAELLAQYYAGGNQNYNLTDLLYYGWPIFGATAKVMQALLHFFYGIVGNYGIAIIMLTVLVRSAMFPLSYKQTKSMARMQALKPEMDRIMQKYKTDMQKRSEAMKALYSKHEVNPLSGCMPMFVQLPIFIGLYRALMVDVELRQSSLFGPAIRWCSNLAAPDMLFDWSSFMPAFVDSGIGMFSPGPYLNVLPIVTVILFLVSQKMFMPEPTNEQMAMQQKMMKYMMVFIGFLFYKVAAGLCLYFIASSLWGIAERKLLPKTVIASPTPPPDKGMPASPSATKSPAPNPRSTAPQGNGSPSDKGKKKARRKR